MDNILAKVDIIVHQVTTFGYIIHSKKVKTSMILHRTTVTMNNLETLFICNQSLKCESVLNRILLLTWLTYIENLCINMLKDATGASSARLKVEITPNSIFKVCTS